MSIACLLLTAFFPPPFLPSSICTLLLAVLQELTPGPGMTIYLLQTSLSNILQSMQGDHWVMPIASLFQYKPLLHGILIMCNTCMLLQAVATTPLMVCIFYFIWQLTPNTNTNGMYSHFSDRSLLVSSYSCFPLSIRYSTIYLPFLC